MTYENNYQESLVNELVKAKEEIELGSYIHNQANKEHFTEHYKDWQDIKLFLLQERVKLIEKSLIDNEVDF